MSNATIINDPIWGPIELDPVCIKIINTPQFQRLRFIKQLGGCSYVYPGACHTRFEHSIGTSYLAGKLGRELQKKITKSRRTGGPPDITKEDILCLEIAGLCHDLGHGPFSHMFQSITGKDWKHEKASVQMFRNIRRLIKLRGNSNLKATDIKFIEELIMKPETGYTTRKRKLFLFEIVANEFNSIDVDKWDYFSRDCHMLGLNHNFQCERTIKLAKVVKHGKEWHISYPKTVSCYIICKKEWFNLFDMFYTRFTLHRRAYQHPVCKAVEMMITDALLKADKVLEFPPDANKRLCLSKSVRDMNAYLWVTDDVVHRVRALPTRRKKNINEAKKILDRIDRRDLYKLVAEKRIKWKKRIQGDAEKKKMVLKSLKEWTKKTKLKQSRLHFFETKIAKFHYGNGDKSPLKNVKFYEKDKSVTLSDDELSAMLPSTFEQVYLRLYWKGSKDVPPYEDVMKAFNGNKYHVCADGDVKLVTTRYKKF